MPGVCDVGSNSQVQADCDARFVNKNGGTQSYLRPKESRTIQDRRTCSDTPSAQEPAYAWNTPTYVPDRTNVCGPNTRSGRVYCVKDGTTEVADASCTTPKPASVQNFDDTSGCKADDGGQSVASIAEIRLGACNYTSSGGGRHACGPRGNYRPGPAAPWPSDLCTGKVIAGDANDFGSYQSPGGKGWNKAPALAAVPGARCVVHWKHGYSDSAQAGWNSAYYDGAPTGRAGGDFIGRKP